MIASRIGHPGFVEKGQMACHRGHFQAWIWWIGPQSTQLQDFLPS